MSTRIVKDGKEVKVYHKGALCTVSDAKGPHGYGLRASDGEFLAWMSKIDSEVYDFILQAIERQKELEEQKKQWAIQNAKKT